MRNAAFLLAYAVLITASNVALKLAAEATQATVFLPFLVAGNLVGFVGVLCYTGLLRTLPLHVAFPLTRGVGVLGVQAVASLLVFREVFRPREAVAIVLVTAGIVLVGVSARPREEAP